MQTALVLLYQQQHYKQGFSIIMKGKPYRRLTVSNEAKSAVTYDQTILSNAEIIAPSIDKTGKDLPARALREGMLKAETKDAILSVTGGEMEIYEDQAAMILNAAATIVKAKREAAKSRATPAKTEDSKQCLNSFTAEKINEMNAKYWG